jgi:hypothetical protein
MNFFSCFGMLISSYYFKYIVSPYIHSFNEAVLTYTPHANEVFKARTLAKIHLSHIIAGLRRLGSVAGLLSPNVEVFYHRSCYKTYTSKHNCRPFTQLEENEDTGSISDTSQKIRFIECLEHHQIIVLFCTTH